jgi:hypothetical protein
MNPQLVAMSFNFSQKGYSSLTFTHSGIAYVSPVETEILVLSSGEVGFSPVIFGFS